MTRRPMRRRGLNFVEVLVVVLILFVAFLFLLMRLPRSRETARGAACKRNLMQIGVALAQYHADADQFPTASIGGPSPLRECLAQLAIPDFDGLSDPEKRRDRVPNLVVSERHVGGFVCPTDTVASSGRIAVPISYRASTGSTPDGLGGTFALGTLLKLRDVEAKDGLAYTASFSERLVGEGGPPRGATPTAILEHDGPIGAPPCPSGPDDRWRTDSGSGWWTTSWTSTLYNHAASPDAATACRAVDDRSALVGASSMHQFGVNVLLLDGAVKSYSNRVDTKIWRSLGTVDDGVEPAPAPPTTSSSLK